MNNFNKRVDSSEFIKIGQTTLEFRIQDGPIKEVGINGCQIDDVIIVVRKIIESFNQDFPCRENSIVITKLQEAELWLLQRKRDRESRNVEGFNKE